MIDPIDFFNQAEGLVKKSKVNEVDSRSALSRGYYSLFHVTNEALMGKHQKDVVDKVKDNLKQRNVTKFDKTRVRHLELSYLAKLGVNYHKILFIVLNEIDPTLGQYFKGARDDRNFADYELKMSFKKDETEQKIQEIKQIISNISSLN